MKRLSLLFLLLAGCSTSPVADMLDYFRPGRIVADKSVPRGGVCGPQQPGPPVIGSSVVPPPSFPTGPVPQVRTAPGPVLGAPLSTPISPAVP
jgi:hypothetical protein